MRVTTTEPDQTLFWKYLQGPGLAAVVFILLIGAAFRFEHLISIPPGMHNDIAQYIADGLRISRSWTFPLLLDSRPEPLWRYILAVVVWWSQDAPFAEKFTGTAVGLLTIAATYRATLELLRLWTWPSSLARWLGALTAASAIISNVSLEFLNRKGFRAVLLPLAVALMLFFWARAWRLRHYRDYAWAGAMTAFPVRTYTARLAAPLAGIGTFLYMAILGKKGQRPGWRGAVIFLLLMSLVAAPQIYLALRVPDLYGHVQQMQTYGDDPNKPKPPLFPPPPDLLNRFNESVRAFYATGNYALNYNRPDMPFLNPLFVLLAIIGLLTAIWWRTLPGVLTTALLVPMTLTASLSMDPTNSVRLIGTFTPLAVLVGFGTCAVITAAVHAARLLRKPYIRPVLRVGPMLGAVACFVVSPAIAWTQFDGRWTNQKYWADPTYWWSFPHYFGINYTDLLLLLRHVDHPVYMPMPQIDAATAAWYLWAEAYPNVRAADLSDPLVGAQQIPDAELWYPYAGEFNVALTTPAEQFALLLPGPNGRNGMILILAPIAASTAAALRARAEKDGTPIIDNPYGWRLGWRLPVKRADVTAPASHADWHTVHARFGDSLELIGYEAPQTLAPDSSVRVTLYWRTLKPVNFDVFAFVQFLDTNNRPYGTSDVWLYRWIHPSVFWQPGEVIPDMRTLNLPADAPQGAYKLAVGAYTPPGQPRLPVFNLDGRRVPDDSLALQNHRIPIALMPTAPGEAHSVGAQFGSQSGPVLILDAYTSDKPLAQVRPGDTVHVREYWHAAGLMDRSYKVFMHATDAQGKMIAQQDIQPFDGCYPTNVWSVGEPITLDYTLTIPADAPPGVYSWLAGAYSFLSLERLVVTQDNQQPADRRAVLR